jgi:hypothetical protein
MYWGGLGLFVAWSIWDTWNNHRACLAAKAEHERIRALMRRVERGEHVSAEEIAG